MSTHNICFYGELMKLSLNDHEILSLSVPLTYWLIDFPRTSPYDIQGVKHCPCVRCLLELPHLFAKMPANTFTCKDRAIV